MSTLNDHDQHLLETLLNHAEAVTPTNDKTQHPEHDGHLDFHNPGQDVHDFQLLDRFINSEMGEAEAMQFEQQPSTSTFVNQQSRQQFQQTPEAHQSGSTGSSFQGQGSSGFTNQQTRFTRIDSAQSPVQMEQSSTTEFQGQGHSYQQMQSTSAQAVQINISNPDGFQNQSAGFQQQYSVVGASAESGQLDKSEPVRSGFSNQSQRYSQQYSIDAAGPAQAELGATFQTQTHQQHTDSAGHVQTQQQVNPHDSVYPSNAKEQATLPSAVYQNQNSDYQHQQTFHNEFSANSGTNNPSLEGVRHASGFQQQYTSGMGSQSVTEQRDLNQQQGLQDFQNSVTGFQQQQQQAQQTLFQQGSQAAVNSNADQTYQNSATEGTSMCFPSDIPDFSQTGEQQQQGTTPTSAAGTNPSGALTGNLVHQLHTQYQSSASSKGDQSNAGMYQGQVAQYQKPQSFPGTAGSQCPPTQQVPGSPASYPQPSQDYGTQHTFPPTGQTTVQGDQSVGVNFAGQVTGFTSGQMSTFQKQSSFQSPVQSPGQTQVDSSVPSSPASNFQQHSPGFTAQSSYPTPSPSLSQGDQSTGGSFATQTAGYSQPVPTHGDQNVVASFQGNAVFSPKSSGQEDPAITNNFQAQSSPYQRCSSAQGDTSTQSQTGGFQQPAYQSQPQSAVSVNPQTIQEGSGHSSMEAEAAEFLQKTFQSVNQNPAMEGTDSVTVPFQQISASQTSAQRDQPMETQQSPYLAGSGSSIGGFQTQSQAPVPRALFHEPATQVGQTNQPASGFLNQTLSFQGQSSDFQAATAVPAQSLPSSIGGLVSGTAQGVSFSGDKLGVSNFSSPSTATFTNQSMFSSGQNTITSFSLTTSSSLMTNIQPVVSATVTNFNQAVGNTPSFNQFSNGIATPQLTQQQSQQQQFHQPMQQEAVQQTVFSSQPQGGSMPLVQNNSSHVLSSYVTEVSQAVQFHPISTAQLTVVTQALPATVLDNQQYGTGQQFQAQVVINTGQQQGIENLSRPTSSTTTIQASSIQNQVPFVQGTDDPVSNMAGTSVVPNSVSFGKSPAASVQDSSQTNSALTMLSSVLQQIQAILPAATKQQQTPATSAQPTVPAAASDDSQALTMLLQSQKSAQQVLQLLQEQQKDCSQKGGDHATQQIPNQAPLFSVQQQTHHHQEQQQQFQKQGSDIIQQPNFLIQQSGQQQLYLAQQQVQQLQQGQPPEETSLNQSQQLAAQTTSSMITSLASSLGSLGVVIGSDGRFIIGQQPVKLLVGASTAPASVSGGYSLSSTVAMPKSSSDMVSLAPATNVSISGQPHLCETSSEVQSVGGLPVDLHNVSLNLCQTSSEVQSVGGLPVDLHNVGLNLFSSSAVSSVSSMTHTVNTTPTVAPNVSSTTSKNTFVTPTSSFTQPLSVAGVGLGVAGPNSAGMASVAEATAFKVPASQVVLSGHSEGNCPVSSSSNTPSVANIFYPISTTNTFEKATEAQESNISATKQMGNFLNVTTGSASRLLNAFSMAVADGKSDCAGLKVGGFNIPPASSNENVFSDFVKQTLNTEKVDAVEMDVGESLEGNASGIKPMDTDKPIGNLTPRHSSRKTSIEEEPEQRGDAVGDSMLRRILTMKDEDGNTPNSKAGSPTPESSPVDTPTEVYVDGNTQATLIEKSEKLRLGSDAQQEDDMQPEFWTSVPLFTNTTVEEVIPSKVHRGIDDLDASSKQVSLPSVEKLFDAGGATSSSAFVFTKFGAEVPGVLNFGDSSSDPSTRIGTSVSDTKISGIVSTVKPLESMKLGSVPTASIRPSARRQKDPGLTFQFPNKVGNCELRILAQPEEQHRARYLTEGSRGAVKDRSQQGYPVIKLIGYNEPATLQIFIGSEIGRVKPHGFYQACKVCGKNSTQCTEREIEGTNVIEIEISPINDMQVNMDCVGILKLRNADVEKRIGPTKAKAKKKNSTKARLVFRCTLRKPDGSYFTLQVASTPILCTQPIGQPEISRMSLCELCVNQTSDLFIIGKNFLKGTQIMFQELGVDDTDIKWQSEAEIEVEYFQQTHLICRIPEYRQKDVEHPVRCQIVALSGGKTSDPQDFVYKPAMVMVKEENAMETEPSGAGKALPFGVSPVALQLNRLVERTQHYTSSSALFQLPPGAIPSISTSPVPATPPKVVSSTPAQPVSSVLKPATLSLPGQTLTLGPAGAAGEMKGAVPVQFVLPSHAIGSAVTLDSRKLGSQPPQLVLMPNPGMSLPSGSALNNCKLPQSVFTLTTVPSDTSGPSPSVTIAAGAVGTTINSQGPTSTSAPMIVILTGQQTSSAGTSTTAASSTFNSSSMAVPLSAQQPVNSGQVESLLKQILESSKSSSS